VSTVYEMESRPGIARYRDFEVRLAALREKNRGADSPEEDDLLDEADHLWWALSEEERKYLNTAPSPNHEALVRWLP